MTQSLQIAFQRWLSLRAYGLFTGALFRADSVPQAMRARFERFAHVSRQALQRKHPRLRFEEHMLGALCVESVRAQSAPSAVVLHLHGGAFVFGSVASYRNRAMRLSHRLDAEVFMPDYRLAPEHPFPAALEDALVAYQYVRALRPHAPIFLSGDSAGGNLVLSLMLRLRELDAPMPNGAIMLSPWTDLSNSGASIDENDGKDLWLSRAHLTRWARYYAQRSDLRTPLLSPVFAELSKLAPMLLLVGEHEVLRDDAVRVAEAVRESGGDARLVIGRRMQHDWPLTLPWLAESRAAWKTMSEFVAEHRYDAGTSRVPGVTHAA